ncbi:MAG: gamma-glutamylcyclotransferase family protein [Roseovarius sp.]|nr:gamma-glutamylcyclotransferase family protein [Roseovarius sp.]
MTPHDAYFFGYGSLVNRATHGYADPQPATLTGWRRVWRHTDLRPVAYLTVVPDPDCVIDGLIAGVPGDDWQALDVREGAYDRIHATDQVRHPLSHRPQIALYTIPEGKHGRATDAHPVLLSYIDVVVQGYLREYGQDGAQRFFDTTDGWNAPVLNDRAAPIYPRHCTLSAEERAFVDDALVTLSAQVKEL